MNSFSILKASLHLGMFLFLASNIEQQAHAITFTVNTTKDELDFKKCTKQTPNNCSLRTAIVWANSYAGEDTIILPAGIYVLNKTDGIESDDASFDVNINPSNKNATTRDLDITSPLKIIGAGSGTTIIDGNQTGRVLDIFPSAMSVTVEKLTIRNGKTSSNGGGIRAYDLDQRLALTVKDSKILNNTAVQPQMSSGGIEFLGDFLYISNTTIKGNKSDNWGGGLSTSSNSTLIENAKIESNTSTIGHGGGLVANGGEIFITKSEISKNKVLEQDGGVGGKGGGIYFTATKADILNSTIAENTVALNGGGVYSEQTDLTMLNVTLSGNQADVKEYELGSGEGGALYINSWVDEVTTTLVNTTITNNSVFSHGQTAGIFNLNGHLILRGNIIAKQKMGRDCLANGVTESFGANLESSTTCDLDHNTDIHSVNPKLGSLADNGGGTRTHAVLDDSPAIDAMKPDSGFIPEFDQRGFERNSFADIGAYESDAFIEF